MILHRRVFLQGALASASLLAFGATASAQNSSLAFPQWVAAFRSRALARGVSEKTYDSVIGGLKPDRSVYALQRSQPEFQEQTWQYLNRRVSDWRITAGKEVAKEHAVMLGKIEREYGVDRIWCWRSGASSRRMAIRWCSRNTCARYFRRSLHWPGASRAAAPTGRRNCSTLW